jgi:hypothetical protein
MKTAYELAMERLGKASPPPAKLTDEQKKRLAELDAEYKAKIADRELFLRGEMEKAIGRDDAGTYEQFQEQLVRDRKSLQAELEEKKEQVRQGKG